MSLGDYEELLSDISQEWDIAEREVKMAEQLHKKVVFPAIKELRYAGRRLADALAAITRGEDDKEIRGLLADARFACHCARHDVIDASMLKMGVDLSLALEKLGHEAVLGAFPEYPKLVRSVQEAQTLIATARQKRNERYDIYEELQKAQFPALIEQFKEFQSNEPLMKKIAGKEKGKRYLAYAIGAGGLALGAIGIFV